MYSILFQQQSDIEWKYGLAKLIRNMHRTNASPAPINLVTTWTQYLQHALKRKFTIYASFPFILSKCIYL